MDKRADFVVIGRLEKAGVVCSGACAVHCLLMPFLAYSSPAISHFFNNEWIHFGLLIVLIPVALISFSRSRKAHGNNGPSLLGSVGMVFLVGAIALESFHIEIANLEKILTAIGSLLLIVGHTLNLSLLRRKKNAFN